MAVSVKMGVDVTQFKQGMQQAQQSAKTLSAQMKANEAQYKATGDKEKYVAEQSKLMKQQLAEQEKAAKNAEQALQAMRENGVDETSTAYQKLAQQLASAQTAMYDTQAALNALNQGEQAASTGASSLEKNLSNINKNVSVDAVVRGIDWITGAMENAVGKAVSLGQSIWDNIMDSAKWADDAKTMAEMWDIPLDKYLKMQALVDTGLDTSVESMLNAQRKLTNGISKNNKDTMDTLKQLGLVVTEAGGKTEEVFSRLTTNDPSELFWEAGKAIMAMDDVFDQDAAAMAIFGKNWRELRPLFNTFESQNAYDEALEGMNVNSEEAVDKLAALNDQMAELEHNFEVLKAEVLAGLAPALTDAANALSGMIKSITEYLKTDEGQKQLERMGDALSGIIHDITDIEPAKVVEGFANIIDKITGAFEWIEEHWDAVKVALIGIASGFLALKVATTGLTIANTVSGWKTLLSGKSANPNAPVTNPSTQPTTTPSSAPTTAPLLGGGGGSSAAAIEAAERIAFGGGSALAAGGGSSFMSSVLAGGTTVGNLSLIGAAGGTAIIAGATIVLGAIVSDLNDAANEAREVVRDEERMAETFRKFEQDYSFGGINKKSGAEGYINAFKHGTGGDAQANAYKDMKNLALLMGEDLYTLFNYTNTSGESQNKLLDMLDMDQQNAAIAGMMLHYAGIDLGGAEGAAAQKAYQDFQNFLQWGTIGSEAYGTLTSFFDRSMETDANGKMRIKGMAASNEIMPVINGQPLANMSGYVMTPQNSKPTTYTYSDWGENQYGQRVLTNWTGLIQEGWHGVKPQVDEEKAAQAQSKAADSMDAAADVMETLPAGVADAVSKVKVNATLSLFPHANGIWSVPWDGYPALLHRNERVIPAGQAQQYNSNIYFGNVNLNNGLEIEALTESIDRRNRRMQYGYGN